MAGQSPNHHVILIHGIRTFGNWQYRLRSLLGKEDGNIEPIIHFLGYVSIFAFLIPPLRRIIVNRFKALIRTRAQEWHDHRVDVVAHSFGTYIFAKAWEELAEEERPKIHTCIFFGSVLRQDFQWEALVGPDRPIYRLINECGTKDMWPLIAQFAALGMGSAGLFGFQGSMNLEDGLINRFHQDYGHDGWFVAGEEKVDGDLGLGPGADQDSRMRALWLPLLTTDTRVGGIRVEPPQATWLVGVQTILEPIKIAPAILLVWGVWALWAQWQNEVDKRESQALRTAAEKLQHANPSGAYFMAFKAVELHESGKNKQAVKEAVRAILRHTRARASRLKGWRSEGLMGMGWYLGDDMVSVTADGKYTLSMIQGEDPQSRSTRLQLTGTGKNGPYAKTLDPVCDDRRPLSWAKFNHSEQFALAGAQKYFGVFDLNGKEVGSFCQWLIKDQWDFLEYFPDKRLLIGSGTSGQLVPFRVETRGGTMTFKSLTGEWGVQPRTSAVYALSVLGDERFILTEHVKGEAKIWHYNPKGEDGHQILKHAFTFEPPRTNRNCFGKDDGEFITFTRVRLEGGRFAALTTSRDGAAILWGGTVSKPEALWRFKGGEESIAYADFSPDGKRVLTVGADGKHVLWNWDGKTPQRLDSGESFQVLPIESDEGCKHADFGLDLSNPGFPVSGQTPR